MLDLDLMFLQSLSPCVEVFGGDAQGEVTRPPGPVGGQLVAPQRRLGAEDQQHGVVSHLKEHVATRFLASDHEPEHVAVEAFGLIEVVGVNAYLDKVFDGSHLGLLLDRRQGSPDSPRPSTRRSEQSERGRPTTSGSIRISPGTHGDARAWSNPPGPASIARRPRTSRPNPC